MTTTEAISICRYCEKPVSPDEAVPTHAYWNGGKFVSHRDCRAAGERAEAIECQTVDADCNDCLHFERGKLASITRSILRKPDGTTAEVTHQPNVFSGRCLKFNRPTQAFPKKWTGRECFEHRRSKPAEAKS